MNKKHYAIFGANIGMMIVLGLLTPAALAAGDPLGFAGLIVLFLSSVTTFFWCLKIWGS